MEYQHHTASLIRRLLRPPYIAAGGRQRAVNGDYSIGSDNPYAVRKGLSSSSPDVPIAPGHARHHSPHLYPPGGRSQR